MNYISRDFAFVISLFHNFLIRVDEFPRLCNFIQNDSGTTLLSSILVQHKQDEWYSHHVEQEVMILDKACPSHHGEST